MKERDHVVQFYKKFHVNQKLVQRYERILETNCRYPTGPFDTYKEAKRVADILFNAIK